MRQAVRMAVLSGLVAVLTGCSMVSGLFHKDLSDPKSQINRAFSALVGLTHNDAVLASSEAAGAPTGDTMAPYRKECYDAIAAWLPDNGVTVAGLLEQSGVTPAPDGAAGLYFFEELAQKSARPGGLAAGLSDPAQMIGRLIPPSVVARCAVLRTTADRVIVELGIAVGLAVPKLP